MTVQANIRGWAGRRAAEHRRQQHIAQNAMEAARATGDYLALEAAAEAARSLGLTSEAAAELQSFENAARAAGATLLRASQVRECFSCLLNNCDFEI